MDVLQRSRLQVIGAGLCWSLAGAFVKLVSPPLGAWQIAGFRAAAAFVFLCLLLRPWRAARWLPAPKIILLAFVYAAMTTLFIAANTRTTAANAIFLQDTAPIWVLLFSPVVLKEPLRARDLKSMALCAAGMALFFMDRLSPGQRDGNMLALISGLGFATIILALRWGRAKPVRTPDSAAPASSLADSEWIIIYGNLVCALACLPIMPALPSGALQPIAIVGVMGVVQLALGYYFLSKGVTHVPAAEASLLLLVEPVLNPVWTFFAAGERPGFWALIGGAIIIGSIAYQALGGRVLQTETAA